MTRRKKKEPVAPYTRMEFIAIGLLADLDPEIRKIWSEEIMAEVADRGGRAGDMVRKSVLKAVMLDATHAAGRLFRDELVEKTPDQDAALALDEKLSAGFANVLAEIERQYD